MSNTPRRQGLSLYLVSSMPGAGVCPTCSWFWESCLETYAVVQGTCKLAMCIARRCDCVHRVLAEIRASEPVQHVLQEQVGANSVAAAAGTQLLGLFRWCGKNELCSPHPKTYPPLPLAISLPRLATGPTSSFHADLFGAVERRDSSHLHGCSAALVGPYKNHTRTRGLRVSRLIRLSRLVRLVRLYKASAARHLGHP